MKDTKKVFLRSLVEAYQDVQEMRIASGNRLVISFRYKLGAKQNAPLEDQAAKKILSFLKQEYWRITDAIAELTSKKARLSAFQRDEGIITEEVEYYLASLYFSCCQLEDEITRQLSRILDDFPIWTEYLRNIEGVGPVIAGYIIAYLDPRRAQYPSSFWKYCGLHVVDGKAPRPQRGVILDFNFRLRSKLLGVLGDQFVKRPNSHYGKIYRDYKHRLENHPKWKKTTAGHRHRAAIRYAVKIFLIDLWKAWRELEGLPVVSPYHEAKLGLVHRKAA